VRKKLGPNPLRARSKVVFADVWTLPAPGADTTAPTVALSSDPVAPDGTNGWYRGPVTLTATAVDDVDPSPVVSAVVDGAAAAQISAPISFITDGRHTVSVTAGDAVGNVSAASSWSAKIDMTAAMSNAIVDEVARTVSFTAADDTSGVSRVEYQLATGSWLPTSTSVTVGPAAVLVYYRAVDQAGNIEAVQQVSVPKAGVTLLASNTVAVLSGTSVVAGGSVTLSTRVAGSGAVPTGTVRVTSHGVQVGQVVLSGGRAVLTVRAGAFLPGTYRLLVGYSGSAIYSASSDTVALTVLKASSITSVTLSPTTVAYGSAARATVRVSVSGLTATGVVTITDGRAVLGQGRLAYGAVTITLQSRSAVGTHWLRASYAGDASVGPSAGTAKLVVVKASARVQAAAASVRTSARATVGVWVLTTPSSIIAAGVVTVRVLIGARTVASGAARLSGGRVSVSLPKLAAGRYHLTVDYSGSTVVAAASASTALTVTR
jgi:hypothetical protein